MATTPQLLCVFSSEFLTAGPPFKKNEISPGTVKPISIELGGRPGTQTISVLQSLTTKLAEARGGELNAGTALRTKRLVVERTLIRAEADALNATNAHEEQANVRKVLGGNEHGEAGDSAHLCVFFFVEC